MFSLRCAPSRTLGISAIQHSRRIAAKLRHLTHKTFHTEENDRERFGLPIVSPLLGSLLELRRVSLARARAKCA
jgi:hypothetical protein